MRALVTSSRNTFALDLIRKLGSAGHTVVASDTYRGAEGNHSKYLLAHGVTASPRFATDRFITDVADLVERYDLDLIVPTFEEAFYLSARRGDLPDQVTLFTGDFAHLARLHDKVSFQKLAEDAEVPVPKTIVATDDASLKAAADELGQYFARAAFSRGGVALLTNTGPLAGQVDINDCHPTEEQPWLVQPFVSGPMVCTYSTVINGKVTAHCAYRAIEQWDDSTSIAFRSDDPAMTLQYTQQIATALGSDYTGQLSFDFVDHDNGDLMGIECNPRSTNGIMMMTTEQLVGGLAGESSSPTAVPQGQTCELKFAVIAEAFHEPFAALPKSLHDLVHIRSVNQGWRDFSPMVWGPATLVHGAKLARGHHEAALAALGDDIVWNGEPISGMTAADAATLEAVHAQRL